jgi:hypothetical protein
VDPVETQTVLLSPVTGSMENWLGAALLRRENEEAAEIAERIRRQRFYSTLPMGGRLLSLRWILDGPQTVLGERGVLQRRAIFEQFPKYAELAQQSAALRDQLKAMPLVPEGEADRTRQRDLFQHLEALSAEQEVLLREIALHRAPAQMVFPPELDFEKAQARLEKGQYVLSFLQTRRGVYVFRFGRDSYSPVEQLPDPTAIERDVAVLLRGLGQLDKSQPLPVELLRDTRWMAVATRLLDQLTKSGLPADIEELIVVPDGPLWYLPFEALQVPLGDGTSSAISLYRVRYAPTVSLAFPDERRLGASPQTAIAAGRMAASDDESLVAHVMDELQNLSPGATQLNGSSAVSADLVAEMCDRLIVFEDVDPAAQGAYGWSPLPLNRGRSNRVLSQLMLLPWGGPQQLVLPGFHTAAEVGLKRGGDGSDLFLSICGLMSTGARTILVSRWKPGGQSTFDLLREFIQELPYTTASDAWQRSVQLISESELVLDREPRVIASELATSMTGAHPFFWAGYLLVDTGAPPPAVGDTAATPR